MTRQTWADIKARMKPETRARLESEARLLSDELHLIQTGNAPGLTQAGEGVELRATPSGAATAKDQN